jgi:hypothetical protein
MVVASASAFAALLRGGRVVTWGDAFAGGDSTAVAAQLQSEVLHVISSQTVFVAFKVVTGIVVWGDTDATAVAAQLASDVVYVAHTSSALMTLSE